MQVIAEGYADVESYVEGQLHRQVRRPCHCPNCEAYGSLSVLGYYWRYVFSLCSSSEYLIGVRRFRCSACAVTVSLLPAFAQPHHHLGNDILDAFVSGKIPPSLRRHADIFAGMVKRFGCFRQRLFSETGLGFGRDPPKKEVPDLETIKWLWKQNQKRFRLTTNNLIRHYRCTVFGKYSCHQPT
jgi:hypothetical protein|tara:strand:+ start:222 stop:773 length:552 start_codon:yes stop_codon:yes gene_type:complete